MNVQASSVSCSVARLDTTNARNDDSPVAQGTGEFGYIWQGNGVAPQSVDVAHQVTITCSLSTTVDPAGTGPIVARAATRIGSDVRDNGSYVENYDQKVYGFGKGKANGPSSSVTPNGGQSVNAVVRFGQVGAENGIFAVEFTLQMQNLTAVNCNRFAVNLNDDQTPFRNDAAGSATAGASSAQTSGIVIQ